MVSTSFLHKKKNVEKKILLNACLRFQLNRRSSLDNYPERTKRKRYLRSLHLPPRPRSSDWKTDGFAWISDVNSRPRFCRGAGWKLTSQLDILQYIMATVLTNRDTYEVGYQLAVTTSPPGRSYRHETANRREITYVINVSMPIRQTILATLSL